MRHSLLAFYRFIVGFLLGVAPARRPACDIPRRPVTGPPTRATLTREERGVVAAESRGVAAGTSPVDALLRAHHAVGTRLDDVLVGHGLSVAKLGILRQLAGKPLPLGALAQRQSCVRSNITQLIDRMEAEGWCVAWRRPGRSAGHPGRDHPHRHGQAAGGPGRPGRGRTDLLQGFSDDDVQAPAAPPGTSRAG